MAKFADCNNTITGADYRSAHCLLLHSCKTVKKSAGWTVPRSSDGTTYNAAGDQITSGSRGVANAWNAGSWVVLREPGGRREHCIQFGDVSGTTSSQFRAKYSANAKFTGGSPGATRVPSASDEIIYVGGGTDASPTYGALFNMTAGPTRYHFVCDSTPINGCYPFCLILTTVGTGTMVSSLWAQEPMASAPVADQDPCLVFQSTAGAVPASANGFGWLAYGTAGQTLFTSLQIDVGPFIASMGTDLADGSDVNGVAIYTAIGAGARRMKGVGATILPKGPTRVYPATVNTATDAKVYGSTGINYVYPFANNLAPSIA